jgi:hypothetical protein
MGADKNSSLWLNSAYTPNSQLRIPTRVCQGHVVTKDLPTLGRSPKPIQRGSTTQKGRDLGNLESTRRTVRSVRADCPRGWRGLSARRARTVRNCYPNLQYCTKKNRPSVMDPRTVRLVTDRPTLKYGPSANFMHQKPTEKMDRKRGAQEPARIRRTSGLSGTSRTIRGDLADGPRLPRGRSTVTSRTIHQVRISTAEEHEKQPQTSNRWISQTPRSLETKFW